MKKSRLLNITPFLVPIALLVFAWYNPFYQSASKTLEESTERSLKSLAILEDLYLITKASSSLRIPIVSGRFEGAAESISSAIKYLSIVSMAGAINLMFLKISHLKIFIFVMFGFWLFSLIPRWRPQAFKVLWFCLLINPGLSVFTHAIHWVDQEVHITGKDTFHEALEKIHKDFTKKEEARKKKIEARKQRQLARNKKRGRDKLTIFQKIGDGISEGIGNAALHIEEDFAITGKAIHFATKKIKTMIINYFTSMLLLSVLLPLGYLFICYQALKYLFPKADNRVRSVERQFAQHLDDPKAFVTSEVDKMKQMVNAEMEKLHKDFKSAATRLPTQPKPPPG